MGQGLEDQRLGPDKEALIHGDGAAEGPAAAAGDPHITVIVAVFNGASTLERCLKSFVDQSYPHKQLVVMDGGSTDGTIEILERHGDAIDYWESSADRGIYDAWNKALKFAEGDWLCFIGADTYFWQSDVLNRMAESLTAHYPKARIVYGQAALIDDSERVLEMWDKPWEKVRPSFFRQMVLSHPTVFHHRDLFDRHGPFDDTFRIAGDYEFLLRELVTGEAAYVPGLVVVGDQVGGLSSDPANTIEALKEMQRAQRRHGVSGIGVWWPILRARLRLLLLATIGQQGTNWLVNIYRVCTGRPWRRGWR